MGFGAHDWVRFHAEHRPDRRALADAEDGRVLSWAELDRRVGAAAAVLRDAGVRRGDRVALVAENDPRVFEVQFAAIRLGALFVPLNWRLSEHEMTEICRDSEPAVLLHDGTWAAAATGLARAAGVTRRLAWTRATAEAAAPGGEGAQDYEAGLAAADPLDPTGESTLDDPTHILYTSGTTGRPKGVLSTTGTLLWQALNTAHTSGFAEDGCHQLNQMPLFHAGGLNVMANPILYFGGQVSTMTRFVPERTLALLSGSTPPVTHFAGIPLMYRALAELPGFAEADLSHARAFVVAGAIAPPELLRRWSERGVPLQPQYGGTETGPMATGLAGHAGEQERAERGSTGRRAFHTDIRLVGSDGRDVPDGQPGEIWLRGPSVTVGYWRLPRADYFDGDWLRTGDAAHRDADGYYYLTGRTRDMYKSGGENVYPAEVENVLSGHPEVADVAVIGVPDERWGEVGLAVVVPAPGAAITLDALRGYAEARLARYKLPARLELVDELPRNVTGKVSRPDLVRRYGGLPSGTDVAR